MSERTPQSKPSTRRSEARGGTFLVGTSRMRSSSATRLPSGLTISRKVGASGVAPCSRAAQTNSRQGDLGTPGAPGPSAPKIGRAQAECEARLARFRSG